VQFGGNHHIVLQVDTTLGSAGAAGGVKPEGSVILAGVCGLELGGIVVQQAREGMHGAVSFADHDDVLQIAQLVGGNTMDRREQVLVHNGDAGAGIVQQVGVV